MSGGQDSTTCLYWAKKNFDKVYAIGFNYGQKHVLENEIATAIAKEAGVPYVIHKIDTIAKFLEIYDNLERAVCQEGDEDNVHKKGMTMIFHQLEGVLEKMGVAVIDPAGQPFDPEKHNAVMHIEDENLGENTVAQVFQKGFVLNEKVIRFATVQVAN